MYLLSFARPASGLRPGRACRRLKAKTNTPAAGRRLSAFVRRGLWVLLLLGASAPAQAIEYANTAEAAGADCWREAGRLEPPPPTIHDFRCDRFSEASFEGEIIGPGYILWHLYVGWGTIIDYYLFPRIACGPGEEFKSPGVCKPAPGGGAVANKNGGCPSRGRKAGNPCNAATGNKYQSERDYASGDGRLRFTRYYNSVLKEDAGLGVGWTSSVRKRLVVSGSDVAIRQADGRGEPFVCNGTGPCTGDPDTKLLLDQDATGYTLTLGDGASERYDSTGRLLSETDRAGKTTRYAYDLEGRLAAVTGPFGRRLTFEYDANGQLATMLDPAGEAYGYEYDANDNLTRVVYPDGTVRTYYYEDTAFPNHLTGIADERGVRVGTYAYDAQGRAILTERAGGQERFTLSYDSDTQTTVTDAVGTQEILTLEETLGLKNVLSRINQSDGKGLTQRFDDQNNLIETTDAEGRITTYTYNTQNQRLSMTEAAGTPAERTTLYRYVSEDIDLPVAVTTPSVAAGQQKTVIAQYDAQNNPIAITQSGFTPAGGSVSRTATLAYNGLGQVTEIDGPRTDLADITRLSYYECDTGAECGQLQRITNAAGHVTTYEAYDAHGRMTRLTDANGVVTTFSYDRRGRVLSLTRTPSSRAARTTTNTYDGAGQLLSVTTPDGITLTYDYDGAGNLLTLTDSLGNRIEYDYDIKGNRVREATTDPDGTLVRPLEQSYDTRNRLSEINAAGSLTQMINDAVGNPVSQTDANANPPTAYAYDALDRLIGTLDALGGSAGYGYDINDRITRVSTPNNATTVYAYDDLGNLLTEDSPDRGTMRYTYDDAGNVKTLTDARGITASYGYDALNRVTFIDYPGTAEDITLVYDSCENGIERLCQVQDQSGTTAYAYDPFGNVSEQAQTVLGTRYTTRYRYDAGDRVSALTYPDGREVTYTRDVLGRITAVRTTVNGETTALLDGVTYRADGLLTAQTFGNGLTESRSYDQQGRLINQFLASADTRVYGYDANGNLIQKQTLPLVGSYAYDALDRLTGETLTNAEVKTLGYGYDPNGNRLTRTKDAKTRNYAYTPESNRLEGINNREAILDAAGNTLSDRNARRRFEYNQAGRLARFFRRGQLKASYVYNYLNQRTRKVRLRNDGTPKTFIYIYDLQGNLISETREDGRPIRDYIWINTTPIAQIKVRRNKKGVLKQKQVLYLHTDHLNTPRLATDTDQTVVWRWQADAFGQTRPDKDPDRDGKKVNIRLRFPGQYRDGESGLYYNWNRYYDPRMGRYVTSDPIGLGGGTNTYLYANANPLRFLDPTGQAAVDVCDYLPPKVCSGLGQGVGKGLGRALGLLGLILSLSGDTPQCDDDDDRCDYQYYKVDIPTCRAISRARGSAAAARCYASAAKRYAACLAGRPIPPLDTLNN